LEADWIWVNVDFLSESEPFKDVLTVIGFASSLATEEAIFEIIRSPPRAGTDLGRGPKKRAFLGHPPLGDKLASLLRSLQGCPKIMNGCRLEGDGHW
jgi:hypothetical protein